MNKKDIPNLISFIRILMVIPLAMMLWHEKYVESLLLFFIGGLSDGLDGFLARRYHWQSRLGTLLDPMGDKLMMLVSYVLLGWQHILPWWLVAIVIGRDFIIVFGSLLYRYLIGAETITPILSSKINTVCQIFLVLLVILEQIIFIPFEVIQTGIAIVLVTTLISGYGYISIWGSRAWQHFKTGSTL